MGGMFAILKVRDGITSYEDPGWEKLPSFCTVASPTIEPFPSTETEYRMPRSVPAEYTAARSH
jgi:hypothetical protein